MSANDSEHLARESRSPPGSHQKSPLLISNGLLAFWVVKISKDPNFQHLQWVLVVPVLEFVPAGLPALQGSEPGQVRKEAATAIYCKCRGLGSPFSFLLW